MRVSMNRASRLPAILIGTGLTAAIASQFATPGDLTLFGSDDALLGPLGLGPSWVARVPDVAGGLGLSAAAYGAISLRWRDRASAAIVATLLLLGTSFLVWWLLAPPAAVIDADGNPFGYHPPLWVAAAALAGSVTATLAILRDSS